MNELVIYDPKNNKTLKQSTKPRKIVKSKRSLIILDAKYIEVHYNFFNQHYFIRRCTKKINEDTFLKEWNVLWRNQYINQLFEVAIMKKYLSDFLCKCRNFIRIFGFCCYYAIKDMKDWIINLNITTVSQKCHIYDNNYEKPFGFVNIDEINIYKEKIKGTMGFKLIAIPKDKSLKNKYSYHVYQHDFTERSVKSDSINNSSIDDGYGSLPVPNNGSVILDILTGKNQGSSSSSTSNIIPSSDFSEMLLSCLRFKEADINRQDADWISTHPESFLLPETPKDVPLDQISEENLHTFDDILSAQQASARKKSYMAMNDCIKNMGIIRNQIFNDGGSGVSISGEQSGGDIRNMRQKIFQRPNLIDGVRVLTADSSRLTQSHPVKSLIDPDKLKSKIDQDIANIFDIPMPLLNVSGNIESEKTASSSIGGKKPGMTIESYEKIYNNVLTKERILMNQIFQDVYLNTFEQLDNLIDMIPIDNDYELNLPNGDNHELMNINMNMDRKEGDNSMIVENNQRILKSNSVSRSIKSATEKGKILPVFCGSSGQLNFTKIEEDTFDQNKSKILLEMADKEIVDKKYAGEEVKEMMGLNNKNKNKNKKPVKETDK